MLAAYDQDFYAGYPAVTRHPFGRGASYYVAAETELDFLRVFYQELLSKAELCSPLGILLPYGVTTAVRSGKREIVFVMNFRQERLELQGIGDWEDAETGEICRNRLELNGFSLRIICRTGA